MSYLHHFSSVQITAVLCELQAVYIIASLDALWSLEFECLMLADVLSILCSHIFSTLDIIY